MQSLAAIRSLRLLPTSGTYLLRLARASSCIAAGAGDPAVHSETHQGDDADEQQQKARQQERTKPPLTTEKAPPIASYTRLESSEVVPPVGTTFQQKRRQCSPAARPLDDAVCVGWDGRPLSGDGEDVGDWGLEQEQEEEYRQYYDGHKPSPLSEVEFVDTRRPISRAWDTAAVAAIDDVVGVLVEDTVDEALQRAEDMFRAAKERGDPDTPWARALARMRGEIS